MGNQLISFRLAPEMVAAIAQRYPGLSPSEGCKALLLETLGLSALEMPSKPGLEDIYLRIAALEARVFTPVDTSVDTPNDDTLMTPDDTLQTPELSSNDTDTDTDDTLLTPDDTPNDDTLMTPDDTLQTPELSSNDTDTDTDDTLLTPDDIKGIIQGILKDDPDIDSLAKLCKVLKSKDIKIPSPRGAAKPTNQNIKPFLPSWWVKG